MKILFLVVCAEWGEHPILADGIRETWGKDNPDVWYLWGNNHKNIKPNDWVGGMEEGYGAMLPKFLDFMRGYLGYYDYVMKTNTGAYIDIPELKKWLKSQSKTGLYAGNIGRYVSHYGWSVDFVSGSGVIFSRDLVRKMLYRRREFGPEHIDDIAYGLFMQRHGIPITPGQRTEDLDVSYYHYYLRSHDGERYKDVEKMKLLHERRRNISDEV